METSEETLMKYCAVDCVKNITILNLHDSGLARLKNINHLSNLKQLVVSFNNLTKLNDIAGMVGIPKVLGPQHISVVLVSFWCM